MTDLRHSLRSLSRQWGLSLTLVLTIALGIGSNAAVYGFVRGFVTPDLPIAGIDRVVSLLALGLGRSFTPLSYDAYLGLRSKADLFEKLGAARESRLRITVGERTSTLAAAVITRDLGEILQLPRGDGAVISDRVRRGELGTVRDLSLVRIEIDGEEMPITGVAAADLAGLYAGRAVDVWIPLKDDAVRGLDRASPTFTVIGRLRGDISADDTQRALNSGGTESPIAVLSYTGLPPEAAAGMARPGRGTPTCRRGDRRGTSVLRPGISLACRLQLSSGRSAILDLADGSGAAARRRRDREFHPCPSGHDGESADDHA